MKAESEEIKQDWVRDTGWSTWFVEAAARYMEETCLTRGVFDEA